MRTTLALDDEVLRGAKQRATEERKTLTRLIEDALRLYLEAAVPRPRRFRLRLLTKRGRGVPGVDLSDRDALYERMEGRG
jgi:hypothetical protein